MSFSLYFSDTFLIRQLSTPQLFRSIYTSAFVKKFHSHLLSSTAFSSQANMQVAGNIVRLATQDDNARIYRKIRKIIFVGDTRVGKSAVFSNLSDQQFEQKYHATFGVDFRAVEVPEENCRLQLWDLSGQERLMGITKNYFRGAQVVVYVADATRQETIANLGNWCDSVHAGREDSNFQEIVLINKMDSPKALSYEEILHQVPENLRQARIFFVSAKDDLLGQLTEALCDRDLTL